MTRKYKIICIAVLPLVLVFASYPVNLAFVADGEISWYSLPFSIAYLVAWIVGLMAGIRLKAAELVRYYRVFWGIELFYMLLLVISAYVEAIATFVYVTTPIFYLPIAGLNVLFESVFTNEFFAGIPLPFISLVMVSLGYTLDKKPKDVWIRIKKTGPKVLAVITVVVIAAAILLKTVIYTEQYYWSNELVWAIEKKDVGKVEKLLKKTDMDVNRKGGAEFPESISSYNDDSRIPLETACEVSSIPIIKMLLNRGADPNRALPSYWTPLLSTVDVYEPEDYEIVKLLLDHGARVEKSKDGEVLPVLRAVALSPTSDEEGCVYDTEVADNIVRIYRLLLEKSPDQTPHGDQGGTPLIQATWEQNLALIEYLVGDQKVSVNEQNEMGSTALIAAVSYVERDLGQTKEIVALLLSHGADKTIKDEEGKTAYDYAVESGNKELADMLK